MRKSFFAALLASTCIFGGACAQVTPFSTYIGGLPAATSVAPTDQLYVLQGGASKRVPLSIAVPPPLSGSTCPSSGISNYQPFANTTGAPTGTTLNIWDGANCVPWATLNQSTHALTLATGVLSPSLATKPQVSGQVRMTRQPYGNSSLNSAGYNWTVYAPDGSVLCQSNVSLTTTSCMQEALNYAWANQMCLSIEGGGEATIGGVEISYSRIVATTTITFPAGTQACVIMNQASLLLSANPGIYIDSQDISYFNLQGQIIYTGTGRVILIAPQTVNTEGFIQVTNSQFYIAGITCVYPGPSPAFGTPRNTTGIGIEMNAAGTPFQGNRFVVNQMNQCLAAFQIDNPIGSGFFSQNDISSPMVNGQGNASVQVGISATTLIHGNKWKIGSLPATSALNTWAQNDNYEFTIQGGSGPGVSYNTGANNNTLITSQNTTGGSKITNSGTGNVCLGSGC